MKTSHINISWPLIIFIIKYSPSCGAHHYVYELNGEEYHEVTDPPWHTLSLGSPQHNKGNWHYDGEYNMIDYMLLYNAYFKNYLYGGYKPYQMDEAEYPFEDYEIVWDINGYPDTIWYSFYTCSEPKYLYATRQIDTKSKINYDGGIHYVAGSSVKFLPGFKVSTGGCLSAHINPSLLQDFYYHKTDVNTCTGGSFQRSAYTSSQIDSLIRLSQSASNSNWLNDDNKKQLASQRVVNNSNDERNASAGLINDILSGTNTNNLLKTEIKVYPNPSKGLFNIHLGTSLNRTSSITITDSYGRRIFEQRNIKDQLITVNISNNKKGIYYLVVNSDCKTSTFKLTLL